MIRIPEETKQRVEAILNDLRHNRIEFGPDSSWPSVKPRKDCERTRRLKGKSVRQDYDR